MQSGRLRAVFKAECEIYQACQEALNGREGRYITYQIRVILSKKFPIQCAIINRFGHMVQLNFIGRAVQVGNGARDFENAVISARRKRQLRDSVFQ